MILLGLAFSSIVLAAQATCDPSTLLKACRELQENAKDGVIQLSTGETFKVPGPLNMDATQFEKQQEHADLTIQLQSEVLGILQSAGKKVAMSDRFKMAFVSSALWALQSYENAKEGGTMGEIQIRLPMPPQDPQGKMKVITKDELMKIISTFSTQDQTRLKKIVREFSTESKKFYSQFMAPTTASVPQTVSEEKVKNVQSIFSEVKENLVKTILRGRHDSDLTPAERSLVQRVQTVALKNPDGLIDRACGNDLNAFYNPESHSISLCKAYYDQPESQIVMMLGHEIGHSLDPCGSSRPLYTSVDGSGYTAAVTKWSRKGKVFAQEIPSGSHPLRQMKECIISKQQVRVVGKEEQKVAAEMDALYVKYQLHMSDADYQKYKKNAVRESVDQGECANSNYLNTEVNEAMADVYGFVALEAHLRSKPPGSKLDSIAAVPFISIVCNSSPQTEMPVQLKYSDPHQQVSSRSLFALQCPSLARSLGCQTDPETSCSNELLSYAAKMPTPAASTAVPSGSAQTPAGVK